MQLRVAVQNSDGSPAMPTKPSRARRWVRDGKAISKWSDVGIYYVQLVAEPTGRETQQIVVGLDPGKSYSGIAVQSTKFTLYLAHLVLPFQRVKERLGAAVIKKGKVIKNVRGRALQRRVRRGRRINRKVAFKLRAHRQKRFSNRNQKKVPPSIKAARLMEIRIVKELAAIFPVSSIVYEVVKADVDKTSGRKGAKSGKGFSPVMVGQYWAISQLETIAFVVQRFGWQKDGNGTSQIRTHLGLFKDKLNKSEPKPETHAVDGIALAASQFVKYRVVHKLGEDSGDWFGGVDVTPAPFKVITRPEYFRRALHFDNASKGGTRKRKGGTVTPFGYRTGDKVQVKTKGEVISGWVGGFTNTDKSQKVSVYDQNWKRRVSVILCKRSTIPSNKGDCIMVRRKKPLTRADELLDELLADCQSPEDILGDSGLLKQLTQRLLERSLAAELTHHLNSPLRQPEDEEQERPERRNSRNGYSKKTVHSQHGEMELAIPRDRNGEFEPILVPKHQRRLAGLDEKILGLYARGLSIRDISAQLEELYGVALSPSLISEVTDAVSDEVKTWQNRPLDEVYPIVYLDALYVNVKVSGRVSKRAVYLVLGITPEGNKELLGLWIGEAEAEGAKFWLKVLTDLRNRGLKDILIACCDGLSGFPQAIGSVYPQTQVQLCIVHLMRNCLCHVPWKDAKAVIADLKPIYQAVTLQAAEAALDAFAAKWDDLYPAVSQIWIRHWENIIPIFDYPMEIRKVIYTTNAIESVNCSLRKVIKTKAVFPDEESVFKLMYLAMNNIAKRWSRPLKDWKAALSHFAILFPERFKY